MRAKHFIIRLEQLQQEYDDNIVKLEQLDLNLNLLKENQGLNEIQNASVIDDIKTSKNLMTLLNTNLNSLENEYNSKLEATKHLFDTIEKLQTDLKLWKEEWDKSVRSHNKTMLDLQKLEMDTEINIEPEIEQEDLKKAIEDLQREKISQDSCNLQDLLSLQNEIDVLETDIQEYETDGDKSALTEINEIKNDLQMQIDGLQHV